MLYKEWDSKVLGMPVYELDGEDNQPEHESYYSYTKFPYKLETIQILESFGYSLCDVSIEYLLDTENAMIFDTPYIRSYTKLDVDRILDITQNSFYMDRFHKDPNLTQLQADNLYKEWVINACNGNFGDEILVFDDKQEILGFSICRIDSGFGLIDLTATDINFMDSKISSHLISKDIDFFYKRGIRYIKTSTQLENIPSRNSLASFRFKELGAIATMSKGIS
jgi:hypothetical protein